MYLCAQTKCGSGSVHGYVSAAYYGYLFAQEDRCVIIVSECLHQVASGQVFICGEYAVGIFTGDSHELGKSCAGADKYGLKALFVHQLVNGYGLSDDHVCLDLNAQLLYIFNLRTNDSGLWQTEFRDTVG